MKTKLEFQVILTVDIAEDYRSEYNLPQARGQVELGYVLPDSIKEDMKRKPKYRKVWDLTETDAEDDWCAVHRKYVGVLTPEQFMELCKEVEFSSSCNTMGMLLGFGMLPAISLETDSFCEGFIINAYVCPLFVDQPSFPGLKDDQIKAILAAEVWPLCDTLMDALKNIPDSDMWSCPEDDPTWILFHKEHELNTKQLQLFSQCEGE